MFNKTFSLLCLLAASSAGFAQGSGFSATYKVDGASIKNENRSHVALESVEPTSSVVYATHGVDLIMSYVRLNKTSGAPYEPDFRETGCNSALLADGGSKITLEFSDVNSHTSQADAISAVGEGTLIKINDGNIRISRAGSAGVNASNGGKVTLENTAIYSYSSQDPSLYTCPGGTIEAIDIRGDNVGQASPAFYSQGDISVKESKLSSSKWSIGSVDGGKLTLFKNELRSGGVSGFLLYGSKKRSENGELILDKNRLTVNDGPLFMVTNTSASITLSANDIITKSGELIRVCSDDWGDKGSNGGNAVLNVNKQKLKGTVYVDSISSLTVNLKKGSQLTGHMNSTENRCARTKVVLSAGSSWKSKGNSYITSIVFEQPLEKGLKQLKGKHVIYYDPSDPDNAYLEGKEYKTGGGVLRPLK